MYTLKQQAAMFKTTVSAIRAQHIANAASSRKCASKAEASTKGTYSGRTAAQWLEAANKSQAIAEQAE